MDTKWDHPFSWSETSSDYGDNKDLNKIEIDYRDKLNQVETNYEDNGDDIKIKTNYGNNKDNFEIETNYGNNEESILLETAACRILLSPHFCLANVQDSSNNIASMVEFVMM